MSQIIFVQIRKLPVVPCFVLCWWYICAWQCVVEFSKCDFYEHCFGSKTYHAVCDNADDILLCWWYLTMLSVIMLMISSSRWKSRWLAALTLTVNLHIFSQISTFLISFLFVTSLASSSSTSCTSSASTSRFLTECLPCWSRPPDPKPESLLAADPRLNWAFRTLQQIFLAKNKIFAPCSKCFCKRK